MPFPDSPLFQKHGRAAGIGLIALLVAAMASVSPPALTGNLGNKTVVDIGVEHKTPLSMRLEFGVREGKAIAEFTSGSDETVLISVPSTWVRREVKNASIDTVTAEPPSLGFTRWSLPPHAGISFRISQAPDSVVLHNPSQVQMKLDLAFADLDADKATKDVLLIQEDTVKLW